MDEVESGGRTTQASGETDEGLRNALLRLTSPHYQSLHREVEELRARLDSLESLQAAIRGLEDRLRVDGESLAGRDEQLQDLLDQAQSELGALGTRLAQVDDRLRDELSAQSQDFTERLANIGSLLDDPAAVQRRITPVLVPSLGERVETKPDEFAQTVAPVIGPAIRHQIREAKQDLIDALYPIIGQIISKAISESMRELTRSIDARLRKQLSFRSRLDHFQARLRGVSDAEMLLRDSLPYAVEHIFLVHRESGLLLEHLSSAEDGTPEDADTIGAMLTAIRDFVRDSFGDGEEELEEITQGDQRILLEGGQFAYLAVVLVGVEPQGFNQRLNQITNEINVRYENDLREFEGEMSALPDFTETLEPLRSPGLPDAESQPESLGRGQKLFLLGTALTAAALLALIIFACIFTVRLWPVVFP